MKAVIGFIVLLSIIGGLAFFITDKVYAVEHKTNGIIIDSAKHDAYRSCGKGGCRTVSERCEVLIKGETHSTWADVSCTQWRLPLYVGDTLTLHWSEGYFTGWSYDEWAYKMPRQKK